MKLLFRLLCFLTAFLQYNLSFAQCGIGYTQAQLNWDALDFLQEGTNVSNAIATNQKFAFGKNRLVITHDYTAANVLGENTTHAFETSSYGTGSDVQFLGNGTITATFQTAVVNVKFSVYDIDYNQKITITALNGGIAQIVTIAKISGTQLLLSTPATGTSVSATGSATTAVATTSGDGTINVDITGPITSFKLAVTQTATKANGPATGQEDGSFWLSDIAACITNAAFPTAYGAVSKPYTGQPGYILTAKDSSVYMVDPATGFAKLAFTDPAHKNINSMGYDPYNKILYYTYSLTGPGGAVNPSDTAINRYNFNTNTFSNFVIDIRTLGIPIFGSGVESGGAAFYDGAYYIGIEGSSASGSTDHSIAWRIDIDPTTLNATTATQAFSSLTVNHDWGDFVISNGTLYDFDGKQSQQNLYHYDLQTGGLTTYTVSPDSVKQAAVDWNGAIFNIGAATGSGTSGEVMPYRGNGKFNATAIKPITVSGVAITGSFGDAASAFRPKSDFGDAPATYDPVALSPAMHDPDMNLRLGPTLDYEWDKPTALGTLANADGTDEDGLTFVRILNMSGGRYQTDVNVFNNTGTNATLAAWIDFNNNGIFEASEGIVQTVASAATSQSKSLYWTGITTNLPANSNSYLRIRLTSAANGMTTSSATGYFGNGEVEDYYLPVNSTTLATTAVKFEAKKASASTVLLTWQATGIVPNTAYEIERSEDGIVWAGINKQAAVPDRPAYTFTDAHPTQPVAYYRLKYNITPTATQYTAAQKVTFSKPHALQVYPNPAGGQFYIAAAATRVTRARLVLQDSQGRPVFTKEYAVTPGINTLLVPVPPSLPAGFYTATLTLENTLYTESILLSHRP